MTNTSRSNGICYKTFASENNIMQKRLTILVADDETAMLNLFEAYLGRAGHEVLLARNGFEAIDQLSRTNIDCCFTDLNMPRMGGVELARHIHERDNTIPVVVMTGDPSSENMLGTLKSGVVDFLVKPFQMSKIKESLSRVMREKELYVNNLLLKAEYKKTEKLTQLNQELKQKIRDVEISNLILQQLSHVSSSRELFNVIVRMSGRIADCDEAHFYLYKETSRTLVPIAAYKKDTRPTSNAREMARLKLAKKAIQDGMPILYRAKNGGGSAIATHFKIRNKPFGILISSRANVQNPLDRKDLFYLNLLSDKTSIALENLVLYENIYENLFSTLTAFVETIEARDAYTKQHSVMVSKISVALARKLGCSGEELEALNVGGNLHDIGKIGIPDNILLKPGKLTDEEYEIIKRHPVIGSNIIRHMGMWNLEEKIVRCHHERFDGKGYPEGLKGEEIPFLARILSVADVYHALTSDRSYRKKMSRETALSIIFDSAGTQFDPEIVPVFIGLFEKSAINSLEAMTA